MVSDALRVTLTRGQAVVDLTAYLADVDATGTHLLGGLTGAGLPPVEARWFSGAGDGAVWRGARVSPRVLVVPLLVEGVDRVDVAARLRTLALVLTPPDPEGTDRTVLSLVEPDGTVWQTAVYRTGGGDLVWGPGTDSATWATTEVELTAPDPYWTRQAPSSLTVSTGGQGRHLLPYLSRLRLTSSATTGRRTVENPGDAPAWPVWQITGPGADFTATDAAGQALAWRSRLEGGQSLTIDTRAGTVVDGTGANRYAELAPAPRFWAVPPGTSTVWVTWEQTEPGRSLVVCRWQPRRWLVF